jgi:hypothetical protein
MATNKNNINYKITVDTETGTASIRDLKGQIVATQVPIKELRARFGNFAKTVNSADFNKFNKGLKASTAELENANKQTGAATSATLEFGRVLSDAPYGIRGVANNVQQLASNLFFMGKQVDATTGKTIGFKGAVGSLIKNLAGPAGILVAFQGVIALFDYFSTSTKKAKEEVQGLTEEFTKLLNKVADLEGKLPDALAGLLTNLGLSNNEFEDFAKNMSKTIKLLNNEFPEFKNAYDKLSDTQKKDPKVISELIGKYKELIEVRKQIVEKENTLDLLRDKQGKFAEANLKNNREEYKTLILTKIALEDIFKKEKKISVAKKGRVAGFETPEELQLKIKSTLDARQKLAKQTELMNLKSEESSRLAMAQSEEAKTFIKEDYANRRLDITEEYEKKTMEAKKLADIKSATESNIAYQRKIDKDLAAFEAKLRKEGKALTDAEAKMLQDAKKAASDKKENANQELMSTVTQIEEQYSKLFPFWKQMAAARRAAIGTGKKIDTAEEFTLKEGLQQYMKVQSAMTDFLSGEYDRQLTIEQNKTNALNNELNQRLLNENLSKDERERIQLQIARNDEKLRKKQEVIEKKRFKLNKAANIANATINTYLAANQIMSDPSFTGRPVARFVAMAATITSGLLNVAAIARQKFQSSAGSGGAIGAAAGRSGGGGEGREFNFNLAGSTQSNQLTQSIAGQLSQPIQAYVVSSEITSQQQLDLSISNTATIG